MHFRIPIRLPSLPNTRLAWQQMAALKKKQRNATFNRLKENRADLPSLPVVVTITRIGKRKLDDDNLAAACKYIRDEIANAYGVDDGSPLYNWLYNQQIGEYSVNVEITARGE